MVIRSAGRRRNRRRRNRRGTIVVLTAVMMLMLMAFVAFSIDVGYLCSEKTACQVAADAAAHAAACCLSNSPDALGVAKQEAIAYATTNRPNSGDVLKPSDVTFGIWDAKARTFTADSNSPNAVKVVVRCSQANGNPLNLFFAPLIGHSQANIAAESIAMIPPSGSGPQFRFLVDDE